MTYSFNLLDEPWIPVTRFSGGPDLVSLRDALRGAHECRELAAQNPLETVGVLTVLLALLHRVFGPETDADWERLYRAGRFPVEPLEQYFGRWHDRFDMFDAQRPFFQVADERVKQPKSVLHLLHAMANTGALFMHKTEDSAAALSAAQAARLLLASRLFHTAGLSGLPQKFVDGIYARGALFYADGDTLFDTLVLNLIGYPDEKVLNAGRNDRPAWEMDDPYHDRPMPYGYLDYLTWPNTRTLLLPEAGEEGVVVREMTIAPGLGLSAELQSPQKLYLPPRKEGDGARFLRFSETRMLWRDFAALFSTRRQTTADVREGRAPAVVSWLEALYNVGLFDRRVVFRLRSLGMLADQAKIVLYSDQRVPVPAALLDPGDEGDALVSRLADAVALAESLREEFRKAVWVLASVVTSRDSEIKPDSAIVAALMDQWAAESVYWSDLETPFWQFVRSLAVDGDAASAGWHEALRAAALDAFASARTQAGTSAHALHGEASGRRVLYAGLRKLGMDQELETV